MSSVIPEIVGPEEPEYAGHEPGTPVPEGRAMIEAQFSEVGDNSWMEEKRSDGTYRWCRAKKRGGKGHCRAPSMVGADRCRIHGGSTPRGIASPNFRHGRYSKALPTDLFKDYDRERLDENITDLSDEIAVLRVRLKQLLELSDVANTAEAWKKAREATKAMIRARKYNKEMEFDIAFDKLCEAMLEEVDYNYQKELTFQIEQIRKLADTENKRLQAMQQLITSNEFMTALNAVLRAVKDNVSNREEVQATLTAIQRILVGTD